MLGPEYRVFLHVDHKLKGLCWVIVHPQLLRNPIQTCDGNSGRLENGGLVKKNGGLNRRGVFMKNAQWNEYKCHLLNALEA